jgi:methylated-DNA-[protein]-cysteine S-methyltransferase
MFPAGGHRVSVYHSITDTTFGPVAVVWEPDGDSAAILGVELSRPQQSAAARVAQSFQNSTVATCSEIDRVTDSIEGLLAGDSVTFDLARTRLERCPPFQQRVLRAEHGVPRGRVTTYSKVAAHLGSPRAARAVGNALANNPFPLIIPCHRAVRADGSLSGYQGGTAMKRALLEMEGLSFDRAGRIAEPEYHY